MKRFCCLLFWLARHAFAQSLPVAGCAVEGSVYNALTGQAVARAQIVTDTPEAKGASTDGAGQWRLTGLPCGPLRLTASRTGFAGPDGNPAVARSVELVAGAALHDVRFGLIAQASLQGTVTDAGGEPLEAQIELFRSVVQAGRRTARPEVPMSSTDRAGTFRANVFPGSYMVCAHSGALRYPVGGGAAMRFQDSCSPILKLESGQEVRTDLPLSAASTVHMRGKVMGVPPNTSVVVRVSRFETLRHARDTSLYTRGENFDLAGVAPGTYMVEASATGDGVILTARQQVQVGSADLEVSLGLAPVLVLTGNVRFESGSGRERPQGGAGQGFRAQLTQTAEGPAASWSVNQFPFTFDAIRVGKYGFEAHAPAPWYVKAATLGHEDVLAGEFPIFESGNIEIVMRDDGGSLEGTVTERDGKLVEADVMLLSGRRLVARGKSGEDGKFMIGDVAPGRYLAYAFDAGESAEYEEPEWMRRNAGPGVQVDIMAGGVSRVPFERITVPK